jgi:hypothetical protein
MAPPKYKDLGKKANDILNEDFKFSEQKFELKSKINGVDVKSTFCDKGKGMSGEMELKQAVGALGDVTLKTQHDFENPSLTLEKSGLVKNLKIKAEVPLRMWRASRRLCYAYPAFTVSMEAKTV